MFHRCRHGGCSGVGERRKESVLVWENERVALPHGTALARERWLACPVAAMRLSPSATAITPTPRFASPLCPLRWPPVFGIPWSALSNVASFIAPHPSLWVTGALPGPRPTDPHLTTPRKESPGPRLRRLDFSGSSFFLVSLSFFLFFSVGPVSILLSSD